MCIRSLFSGRPEPIESGVAFDAPIRTHPNYAEKIFLEWAAAVRAKNLSATAVRARSPNVQLHSQDSFSPPWSEGGWDQRQHNAYAAAHGRSKSTYFDSLYSSSLRSWLITLYRETLSRRAHDSGPLNLTMQFSMTQHSPLGNANESGRWAAANIRIIIVPKCSFSDSCADQSVQTLKPPKSTP